MKKLFTHTALRMIPKKKQDSMICQALNYLLADVDLSNYETSVVSIRIKDTKFAWNLSCNSGVFNPSDNKASVTISFKLDDIFDFPTRETLKQKIASKEIHIEADKQYEKFALDMLDKIDQIKVTKCARRIRQLTGDKLQLIKDKPLNELSIRDITCQEDIDYIRDQALNCEKTNPALAYQLMMLAHGARPQGPFIKRKVHEYRGLGFDRLTLDGDSFSLRGIEIVKGDAVYFPVPKAACSSIKSALYFLKNERIYNIENYNGKHIHDYWYSQQKCISTYSDRVIVIRDPIERFLSAYSNRVHDHGELNRDAIERDCPWLVNKLPHFKPNISQFICDLERYMLVPVIGHHCKPISQYVNNDLSIFTHVYPLESILELQQYLTQVSGKEIKIPRAQVGYHKISIGQLSESELERLFVFFDNDYRLLAPWYSKERIRQKWHQAKIHGLNS